MDIATSDIQAVELIPSSESDSPVLPELFDQISESEEIGTVTAGCLARTPAAATQPSLTAKLRRSSRLERTDGRRKRTARPQSLDTKPFVPPGTMAGRLGSAGPATRIKAKMRCLRAFGEHIAATGPPAKQQKSRYPSHS